MRCNEIPNMGVLPEHIKQELAKHLRELFKGELSKRDIELGLPYEMICRHPFQVLDCAAEAVV